MKISEDQSQGFLTGRLQKYIRIFKSFDIPKNEKKVAILFKTSKLLSNIITSTKSLSIYYRNIFVAVYTDLCHKIKSSSPLTLINIHEAQEQQFCNKNNEASAKMITDVLD